MLMAREQMDYWKPITNKNCFNPHHQGIWVPNGKSFSCSWCGSMSTEEVLECLTATPPVGFSQADNPGKVYIERYPHAGDCVTSESEDISCSCKDAMGGGPIKFYSWHLFDGVRAPEEVQVLWYRIRVECERSWRELTERMRSRRPSYYE